MDGTIVKTRARRRRSADDEPHQTVAAIRSGAVDAFVVGEEGEEKVYVLKPSDVLYRQVVEEMGEGTVILTRDGAISYCNRQFAILVGADKHEILGRPFARFIAEGTQGTFGGLMSAAADGRCELDLVNVDGTEIPVMAACSVLPDDAAARCCIVLSDLRERRLREQLRTDKEAAERASSMKDEFLAVASHELRTPLTAILGWTNMMQHGGLSSETQLLAVESIHHSTLLLTKLVDDILDSARLTRGQLSLQLVEVDLRDVARVAVESMYVDLEARGASVSLRLSEAAVRVRGDAGRLQQIVVNLLGNAVRFSPTGGVIDVSVETAGSVARLQVTDHGEGIDPAFLPYVFESFRQEDSSMSRAHRGLGLGLSIASQLVRAHGGSIAAASEGKGKGATFTVELPLIG